MDWCHNVTALSEHGERLWTYVQVVRKRKCGRDSNKIHPHKFTLKSLTRLPFHVSIFCGYISMSKYVLHHYQALVSPGQLVLPITVTLDWILLLTSDETVASLLTRCLNSLVLILQCWAFGFWGTNSVERKLTQQKPVKLSFCCDRDIWGQNTNQQALNKNILGNTANNVSPQWSVSGSAMTWK